MISCKKKLWYLKVPPSEERIGNEIKPLISEKQFQTKSSAFFNGKFED